MKLFSISVSRRTPGHWWCYHRQF